LSGFTGSPPHRQIAKTALGAEQTVAWSRGDAHELIRERLSRGWHVAAIETVADAVDLFDWEPAFPAMVVFGHEVEGLPDDLVTLCKSRVRIPMAGAKRSLNVATAGGVVLYELLRKFRSKPQY
jgi:tRNA G18 (ribose-2'-O)-methylase SpoU